MDHIPYKKNIVQTGSINDVELDLTLHEVDQHDDIPSDSLSPLQLTQEEQDRLMNKVTLRIVPFLTFLYVLSYLDRASLSNVHRTILKDLHMEEEEYANAVGIFFFGYILLGVPSNIALVLIKARVWLSGIMVAWGGMCVLMMFAKTGGQLLTIRFFLGCAEAGFVPGVFLYLTYWFLPHERARQLAMFISSNAMAGLLGGLLAYAVEKHLEGALGLHWWQFLFLIEGSATVVFGFSIFFLLPDSPASAKWLNERERNFLVERYRTNNTESHTISLSLSRQQWISMIKTTLSDKYLWIFSVADFCSNGIMITITFFLPVIIQEMVRNVSDKSQASLRSNLLSAIPYGCALVVMMINAIHSDIKKERPKHIIVPCIVALVAGGCLVVAILQEASLFVQMFLICIIVSCVWGIKGPFLAWMTYGLRGNNAIGIGIVNSIANISGWIGPSVQAAAYEATGKYVLGFTWQGALLIILILSTFLIVHWEKKSPQPPSKLTTPESDQGRLLQEMTE